MNKPDRWILLIVSACSEESATLAAELPDDVVLVNPPLLRKYFGVFNTRVMSVLGGTSVSLLFTQQSRSVSDDLLRKADRFVNTARVTELTLIDGVGIELANQIVDERNRGKFRDLKDLRNRVPHLRSESCQHFSF